MVCNVKAMHSIAESIGAAYLVFLQPTMGLEGAQSLIPKDIESQDAKQLFNMIRNRQEYLNVINNLYKELRKYCLELDYCIDISDTAPPTGNMYFNSRHHNKNGNKVIAREIAKSINSSY
jgi:hypothetical protein